MSHDYVVSSCSYRTTGGSGDENPVCYLRGQVDGVTTSFIGVYYKTILQAHTVGGVEAVRAVLAPILFSAAYKLGDVLIRPPFERGPVYEADVPPASNEGSGTGEDISVQEALAAGTWTQ